MLNRLRAWGRHLVRRRRVDRAFDEELDACLDILSAAHERYGLPAMAARRSARLEIGGIEPLRQHVREARPAAWVLGVGRDLRYAVRGLNSRRAFTATAVVSLAVSIGAATAVLSWGRAMFFSDPAGVPDPSSLVALFVADRDPTDYNTVSPAHLREIEQASGSLFTDVAGSSRSWAAMTAAGASRPSTVEYVTGRFFAAVRVPLVLGRGLEPQDDVTGAPRTVVLSHHVWQDRLASDPTVVGQTIRLNGQALTIVGVASATFTGLDYSFYGAPDVWTSRQSQGLLTGRTGLTTSRNAVLRVVARLRAGVTREAAAAALVPIGASLSYQSTDYARYTRIVALSLRDARIPSYTRAVLGHDFTALLVVVLLIVGAACINIANFLLSQGITRQDELSLRLALGATRRQILRQLLTECVLLGVCGGGAGLAVSVAFAAVLEHYPLVTNLGVQLKTPVAIDLGAGGYAAAATTIAVLAFGLLPAWLVSARAPMAGRQTIGTPRVSHRALTSRQIVLALQVAVSVVLTVAAGLYARSLLRIDALDYPYDADHLLLARVNPTALPASARQNFYDTLARHVRDHGDVVAAGYSYNPLLQIGSARVSLPSGNALIAADYTTIGPGFFDAIGVRIIEGRDFRDDDAPMHATIMNRPLADRLWPHASAIGRTVLFPGLAPGGQMYTVVGVVDQPRCQDRMSAPSPCVYWLADDARMMSMTLHIRTRGQAAAFAPAVRQIVSAISPEAAVEDTSTLREEMDLLRTEPRVSAGITAVLACIAGALTAIGCSALLLALIRETQREIAIRLALGSSPRRLTRHVMTRALLPYFAGLIVGFAGAWLAAGRLAAGLYQTTSHDAAAFVVPAIVLAAVGLAASYGPTRAAIHTNPAALLRS